MNGFTEVHTHSATIQALASLLSRLLQACSFVSTLGKVLVEGRIKAVPLIQIYSTSAAVVTGYKNLDIGMIILI